MVHARPFMRNDVSYTMAGQGSAAAYDGLTGDFTTPFAPFLFIDRFSVRLLPFVVLALFVAPGLARSPDEAWVALDERRLEDALKRFTDARKEGDTSARTAFGIALARLNAQPRTPAALESARREFEGIIRDHAGTEEAVRSQYFLARIAQIHAYTPDPAAARKAFLALLADHPDHVFAQLALAKVAEIELYEPTLSFEERLARFQALSARGAVLTHWPARRDFHQVMAQSALFFDLPLPLAQRHLLASLEAGFSSPINRANVVFRAAEVAAELGDAPMARRLYDEFLHVLPRDARARLARERRDALAATAP